ncbi:MAG: hypothetical protein EOM20_14000 [Spartobacteria bacterium]|nr:hypothetical protein [Spartobacteria bacterium]
MTVDRVVESKSGCGGQCAHCALGDAIGQDETISKGWRLVLPAVGVFLVPLALALTGAVLFRGSPGRQTVGAFGGLMVGLLIAGITGFLMRKGGQGQ